MDDTGRGRIGCISGTAILLVVAGAMVFTNPNFDAHKRAVYEHAQTEAADEGVWARIKARAAEAAGVLDFLSLRYANYYACSATFHEGKLLSVGLFGKVFVVGDPSAGRDAAG